MSMRLEGIVNKGWGHEHIWVTNEKYCSKFLSFEEGKMFSMHFHRHKTESWYVMSGKFLLKYIDTKTSKQHVLTLFPGNTWTNKRLFPHQLVCLEKGDILEVSTPDSIEDNYRISPGDSQK